MKQYAVARVSEGKIAGFITSSGKTVFDSLEEAQNIAINVSVPNVQIFSRDVSEWKLEGDLCASKDGRF